MHNKAAQFYPTPRSLADKAWSLFNNKNYQRVLEPSAGLGDLLSPVLEKPDWSGRKPCRIDTVEANINHHPVLREKGCQVVAVDFLNFQTAVSYSHVILNPPFNKGVDHVLHAWDILKDGELVAIINAETVKNPCSAKRQLLNKLIAEQGCVEFVQSAFEDPDTLRKTSVEVALIYLQKHEGFTVASPSNFHLNEDDRQAVDVDIQAPQELALPNSTIKNTVRAFNAAVETMKTSVFAAAEANYYRRLIEVKVAVTDDGSDVKPEKNKLHAISYSDVEGEINKQYDDLLEHAWRKVLQAADFTSRFTRNVRRDIEKQLIGLTTMQFTAENIYALLGGLIANKTELDIESICETFDTITKYHTDNRFHYIGWKSNDKHKVGLKIRPTRFILPHMSNYFNDDISTNAGETLLDIDRAFALLDGKTEPAYSMLDAATDQKTALLQSERLKSDYFEIRFYPKAGTMHFFPTRKDLVERMNRIVGRHREWLPPENVKVDDGFWLQYSDKQAAKVTRQMEKAIKEPSSKSHSAWEHANKPETLVEDYLNACETLSITLWQAIEDHSPQADSTSLDSFYKTGLNSV